MVKYEEFKEMIGKVVSKQNGLRYILEYVSGRYAVIRVKTSTNMPMSWEVWKLRRRTSTHEYDPNGVWVPGNEDFGYYGWSYATESQAKDTFDAIEVKEWL